MSGTVRVGVDVGGTFTDCVVWEPGSDTVEIAKVPTSPADPSEGVLRGVKALVADLGVPAQRMTFFAHGTTIATNALLERRGAATALVTTEGFRDVLAIRRISRPEHSLYDLRLRLAPPLVARRLRYEVTERMGHDGGVRTPLDTGSVRAAAAGLRAVGVEAVAVCLLHAFANPAHEREVAAILRDELPDVDVSVSCEVSPLLGEYERTSTTVANAYIQRKVVSYLERISGGLEGAGVRAPLQVMQSNGGLASVDTVRSRPILTALSGPSAGAIAGRRTAALAGFRNVINVDMGGTSCDVSLAVGGALDQREQSTVADHVIRAATIDIRTIGAGGGSLARPDGAGGLRVGPESAGALPGPASYGKGGTEPTVTDANVLLGLLGTDVALGGELLLDRGLATEALARAGEPLRLEPLELAAGIRRIVNTAMVGAIRSLSITRGHDPRDFAMVVFGGAGGVHAAALAREVGVPTVVVPPRPGCHSAYGLVIADARHDHARSVTAPAAAADPDLLERHFADLERVTWADLDVDGIPPADRLLRRSALLRYRGQDSTLEVPLPSGTPITPLGVEQTVAAFHDLHRQAYGFEAREDETELVELRVVGEGNLGVRLPERHDHPAAVTDLGGALAGGRRCWFETAGLVDTPVYERTALPPGATATGPAVVQQADATTVVPPACRWWVDGQGNLLIGLD